jgi:hypothetical protein
MRLSFKADGDIRSATRSIRQGRPSRVPKILSSHGTAPRNEDTTRILREMHLERPNPLRLHNPRGPQIVITPDQCYARLMREAGQSDAPFGFWGGSPEQLVHDRAIAKTKSLSWQIARMQAHLGSGTAPPLVYYMCVIGSLTALNKLSEDEQQERANTGLDRKIRPINSGCFILKTSQRCVLDMPSAKRVADQMTLVLCC